MKKIYTTKSPEETQNTGKDFAKEVAHQKQNGAAVLCLYGDLGSGKTTFMQGFAKGLGVKEKILSPTFVIMKKFPIPGGKSFYHIDCYRLNSSADASELGLKEILSSPQNIVALEWPEKIQDILPKNPITLDFKFVDQQTRQITIEK